MEPITKGLRNKLTGQIGEYLVCAELGRRGFIATPFAGNVPGFDVVAINSKFEAVPIQVKATRTDNWPSSAKTWMDIHLGTDGVQINRGDLNLPDRNLIYVCVAIADPADETQRDRFFIVRKWELQRLCVAGYTKWMEAHGWKRPRNPASYDCRYSADMLQQFEGRWKTIIEQLREPDATCAAHQDP